VDRAFAARLAVDLTRAGINVWYDQWAILPGDSIIDKINIALQENDYLLIVLSPEAVESQWARREINSSLLASLAGRSVSLVPILKSPCNIPPLIADLRHAEGVALRANTAATCDKRL
jgi:TIR domain